MSEPQFVEDDDEALEEALAAAKQLEGIEASEMSDMEQRVLIICIVVLFVLLIIVIVAWRYHRANLSRLYEWDASAFNGLHDDWLKNVPVHFFEYGASKKKSDALFGTPGTWMQRAVHFAGADATGSATGGGVGGSKSGSRSTPSTPRSMQGVGYRARSGSGSSCAAPTPRSTSVDATARLPEGSTPAAEPVNACSSGTSGIRLTAQASKAMQRAGHLRPPALTVPSVDMNATQSEQKQTAPRPTSPIHRKKVQ